MKYDKTIINDAELFWQSRSIHNILSSEESKLQNNLYVAMILFLSKYTLGDLYILYILGGALGDLYWCSYVLKNLRVVISEKWFWGEVILLYMYFFPKISPEIWGPGVAQLVKHLLGLKPWPRGPGIEPWVVGLFGPRGSLLLPLPLPAAPLLVLPLCQASKWNLQNKIK